MRRGKGKAGEWNGKEKSRAQSFCPTIPGAESRQERSKAPQSPRSRDGTKKNRTYQFKTISNPPPSANPLTAAMIGFLPTLRLMPANPVLGCMARKGCSSRTLGSRWPISIRSCPAQNALGPAPVITATRSVGSRSNHSNTRCRYQCTGKGIEFICFTRLIVTSRMLGAGTDSSTDGSGAGGAVWSLRSDHDSDILIFCLVCE